MVTEALVRGSVFPKKMNFNPNKSARLLLNLELNRVKIVPHSSSLKLRTFTESNLLLSTAIVSWEQSKTEQKEKNLRH